VPNIEAIDQTNTIKKALRDAETPAEVQQVADTHRDVVRALHADEETRVLAIQLANLKEHRLRHMGKQ
jgi:hypothetical protein